MLSPFRAAIAWTSRLTTFDALAQPAFRRLWTGAWLWYTCRWMEMVVLSWLVLQLTDSPFMVSLGGGEPDASHAAAWPCGGQPCRPVSRGRG